MIYLINNFVSQNMVCSYLSKCDTTVATHTQNIHRSRLSLKEEVANLWFLLLFVLTSIVNCTTVLHNIKHPHAYCTNKGNERRALNLSTNLKQIMYMYICICKNKEYLYFLFYQQLVQTFFSLVNIYKKEIAYVSIIIPIIT